MVTSRRISPRRRRPNRDASQSLWNALLRLRPLQWTRRRNYNAQRHLAGVQPLSANVVKVEVDHVRTREEPRSSSADGARDGGEDLRILAALAGRCFDVRPPHDTSFVDEEVRTI